MYIQYIYKYKRTTPIGSPSSPRATTDRTPYTLHRRPHIFTLRVRHDGSLKQS